MNKDQKYKEISNTPDLSSLNDKYENKWVALSKDYKKVLAFGDKLLDVLGVGDPDKVVLKVLPKLGYAPRVL